jgi:hypothetical protein
MDRRELPAGAVQRDVVRALTPDVTMGAGTPPGPLAQNVPARIADEIAFIQETIVGSRYWSTL